MQQASFYCPQCHQPRLFTRQGTNHILHLLLCVFMCGLWIPIWLLITIGEGGNPYHCSQCGFADRPNYLANPNLRAQEARQKELKEPSAAYQWLSHPNNTWKVALGVFTVVGGIIGLSLYSSNQTPKPRPVVATQQAPAQTPAYVPKTDAERLNHAITLYYKSRSDYFDKEEARRLLRAIPKKAKEYKEAQKLLKEWEKPTK